MEKKKKSQLIKKNKMKKQSNQEVVNVNNDHQFEEVGTENKYL